MISKESMNVKADETYAGLIDWNPEYRKYYQMDSIKRRLLAYLQIAQISNANILDVLEYEKT